MAFKSVTLARGDEAGGEGKYRPRINAIVVEIDRILSGLKRKQARTN